MKWNAVEAMYLKDGCALSERFWDKLASDYRQCKISPDWMMQVMWEDFNRFDEWITPAYVLTYRKVYVPVFERCGPVIAQALNEGYRRDLNEWACRCC